jgi:UPF0716 family protein affecting phage T7 exclusion
MPGLLTSYTALLLLLAALRSLMGTLQGSFHSCKQHMSSSTACVRV